MRQGRQGILITHWLHRSCMLFLLSFKKIHIKVYVYLDIYGNPENYKSILWRLFSEEGKEWPKIFFLVTMQRTPRGSLLWKNFGEIQSILNIQYVFFFMWVILYIANVYHCRKVPFTYILEKCAKKLMHIWLRTVLNNSFVTFLMFEWR